MRRHLMDLPDYVGGLHDLPLDLPIGTSTPWISLLATKQAELTNATVDGQPLTVMIGAKRGHPCSTRRSPSIRTHCRVAL